MKITIIYDNTVYKEGLRANWGFSCLIQAHNKNILFDTGASGSILLDNMQKLSIAPVEIDDIFISHAHFDHTGGLSAFLDQNNNLTAWIPPSFRGLKNVKEVKKIERTQKLYEGIYSTGELEGIEQSLCVETPKGIVVIVGCSHPDMKHILKTASTFGRVYGIIGGLHGTRPESLKGLELICPTHCTQFKSEIESLYPDKNVRGGAGRIIEI